MEQPRYSDPDRQESIPFQMRIWKWESEPLTDIRSIASKQRSNPLLPASKVAREIAISTVSKRRTMIGEGKDMKVRYQGILDYVHNEMSLHLAEELIAILELNPDLAILPLTYNPVLD